MFAQMQRSWAAIAGTTTSASNSQPEQPLRPTFTPLDSTRRVNSSPSSDSLGSNTPSQPRNTPLPSRIESLADVFPSIRLEHISPSNVRSLQELNDQCFPIKYEMWFYNRIMANPQLTVLCFDKPSNKCIGAIMGRKELATVTGVYDVYISTVAVLPSERGKGLASGLLETLISKCKNDADPKMRDFVLHVHVVNQTARNLYLKQGFQLVETVKGYYRENPAVPEPRDAFFLRLRK
ncbi:acyl-CoA N-acyltransferase [Rhizoclosmatium globosum]|uniref:Acyl-CoA N-acyltransferase n=1 Tax=Rhizoclosmatium globosum TaxID=329046 RepID=A0A1Y2CD99_9FUNG|nr:acyl-CoA N-acyltransferase [Rhizoclosmatium globosum]|eukprot:ORY44794.1 acyl-CoA N-acyltransferase [Rhizoclosmatium globosum]